MVKKRFFIGFNGILLALFLDICLLISIRVFSGSDIYVTIFLKRENL